MDLDKATSIIDKEFGKGTIQNFEENVEGVKFVSSGSIKLDIALGGGWAKGRIAEIYGSESSGKTTAAIHAAVEVQMLGQIAIFLDFENAFDPHYGAALGLDYSKDKWRFSQPNSGEDGFEIIEKLLGVPEIGIIIVDSVAAMIPRAEIDGDYGDSKMGLHARLMSQAMRKLVGIIKKSDCIVLFINQTRDKIGVIFGDPSTTTGGHALKFYASQRAEIKKFSQEKSGDEVVSILSRIKIKKNKVAPPFKQCEIPIRFGEGFDHIGETLDLGVEFGIIKKSGSWYNYRETRLGQGRDAVRTLLEDNEELVEEITKKVKIDLGLIEG